jgi:hypothetical protein
MGLCQVMTMTIWMCLILSTAVIIETMGKATPTCIANIFAILKSYQWYKHGRFKQRTKLKGCKKCRWRRVQYMLCALQTIPINQCALTIELDNFEKRNVSSVSEWERDDYALTVTNHMRFETDSVPIKVDNCCTQTITGFMEDFVPNTTKTVDNKQVRGFGHTINKITHQGTVRWVVYDDEGKEHDIIVPNSYYVPECGIRLLSPQHWAQELKDNFPTRDGTQCTTYQDRVELHWNQRKHVKTMYIDSDHNNVATMWTKGSLSTYNKTKQFIVMSNEVQDEECNEPSSIKNLDNHNEYRNYDMDKFDNFQHLSREQVVIRGSTSSEKPQMSVEEELMQWHIRFGHLSMTRIQSLASEGVLPKRLSTCKPPVCAGCLYGKLTRQPWRTKGKPSHIDEKATMPGECVSVDQMISTVPGLVAQMKGIPTRARYKIATIFVDHASDYTYAHFQTAATSLETVQSKLEFERHAASAGVTIKRYHCDNGRFVDNMWTKDMRLKNQALTLCGVNAHHQNGKVEKRIRDLQEIARTSLVYAETRWPDAVNSFLWPYALRKGVVDLNTVKHPDAELSPLEKFANVKVSFHPRHHHSFACPMYVLDARLQEGNAVDKWQSRARLAVYLGPSLNHAANVGLALSMTTGLVSPTFHAKYDDGFETVAQTYGRYLPKSQWQIRCGFKDEPQSNAPVIESSDQFAKDNETNDMPIVSHMMPDRIVPTTVDTGGDTEGADQPIPSISIVQQPIQGLIIPATKGEVHQTRSGRVVKAPSYLKDYVTYESSIIEDTSYDFTEGLDPIALMMTTSQDTLYFHEILREPDKMQFIRAMQEEINNHNVNNNWVPILRKDIPVGHKVIPSVWAMRRKRRLVDGSVSKWKARLNVDGSKQIHGTNYWETYAPVAQWISIRTILCMAAINSWKVKTFDFVQAFPQAPSEAELYIDVPKGCTISDNKDEWAMKVINNIYGQKQAGRVWYKYLTNKLINELHFQQS